MKTVIIGASTNPARYSYLAAQMLKGHGHDFVPVGLKDGLLFGVPILDIRNKPEIKNVDTITMYVSAKNQSGLYDYLISLKPRRIIFNPGAENEELANDLKERQIEVVEACTLVMLRTGQF